MSKKEYYKQIDSLRAIAVVAVFANHLNPEIIPFGYLGVDVFFVISGFVITLTLSNSISSGIDLRECLRVFYTKRIKRIMPALLVFTLITGAAISLFDPWNLFSLRTGIAGIFGVSNLYLLRYSLDYFKPTGEINPFLNTWSLGVEEQYYLLYPLLLFLAGAFSKDRNSKWKKRLIYVLLFLGCFSLIANIALSTTHSGTWSYYLMPSRFWEIALGCLSALTATSPFCQRLNKTSKDIAFSIVSITLIAVFFFKPEQFTGLYQVVPAILACLLTTLLIQLIRVKASPAWSTIQILTLIGLLSYSIYLWHWSVIVIFRFTMGVTSSSILLIVLLTGLLASLSYYLVEKPSRYGLFSSNPNLALASIGATTAGIVSFLLLIEQPPAAGRSNPFYTGKLYTSFDHISQDPATYFGKVSRRNADICTTKGRDLNQLKTLVRDCTLDRGSNESLLFIGDSHAMALLPLAEQISLKHDINTTVITGECTFPAGLNTCPEASIKKDLIAFEELIKVNRSKHQRTTVISTSFFPLRLMQTSDRVPGHSLSGQKELVEEGLEEYKESIKSLLKAERLKGIRFYILINPPVFHNFTNPTLCSPQWFRVNLGHTCSSQTIKELAKERQYITNSLISIEQENGFIKVLDPLEAICKDISTKKCSPVLNGELLYHDFNHLNSRGAVNLEDLLLEGIGYTKGSS